VVLVEADPVEAHLFHELELFYVVLIGFDCHLRLIVFYAHGVAQPS
jgi:hypothetical protein